MTETEIINELKDAYLESKKFRKSLDDEMGEKARQGELWTYSKCADWDDYQKSLVRLEILMEKNFG